MSQYLIPKSAVIFEEEIKKSRFITYLRQVDNLDQAKLFWQEMRKLHPTARHHCWATVAGAPTDSQQYGFSDDGEPAGTAGKPMLSTLIGSHIGEICAVVVRYYGGIQLGTGGLVRAYGNGVQQALKQLDTVVKVLTQAYQLDCDYAQINWLQILFDKYGISVADQQFGERVSFQLGISDSQLETFSQELSERSAGQLHLEKVREQ